MNKEINFPFENMVASHEELSRNAFLEFRKIVMKLNKKTWNLVESSSLNIDVHKRILMSFSEVWKDSK